MNNYIRLFHGRESPETVPNDWGSDGPVIGPVQLSWTYGKLKIHDSEWNDFTWLPEVPKTGLVYFEGVYYGDFEVSTEDPEWLAAHQRLGTRIVTYEEFERIVLKDIIIRHDHGNQKPA